MQRTTLALYQLPTRKRGRLLFKNQKQLMPTTAVWWNSDYLGWQPQDCQQNFCLGWFYRLVKSSHITSPQVKCQPGIAFFSNSPVSYFAGVLTHVMRLLINISILQMVKIVSLTPKKCCKVMKNKIHNFEESF